MNTKHSVCQFFAKVLIIAMAIQGWPLWELSRAYTWDYCPEKLAWVFDMFDSPDAAAKPAKPTADTDHDGMPDEWETASGTDPAVFDGFGDPDADGYANYMEYVSGSDPSDAGSVPSQAVYAVPEAHATIQAAIDAAKAGGGGIVAVSEGIYEENIKIYDDIRVMACGDPALTVIDGGGRHNVVILDGVNSGITGFMIRNSGKNGNFSGINCVGNENPEILNCVVTGNNHGIRYGGSASPLIFNNTAANNAGNGIFSDGNAPGTVVNNIVAGNGETGVMCNGKAPALLLNNTVWGNAAGNYDVCAPGDGDMSQDPLFADHATGDFSLLPGSPCLRFAGFVGHGLPRSRRDFPGRPADDRRGCRNRVLRH